MNTRKVFQELLKLHVMGKKKLPILRGSPAEGWDAVGMSEHLIVFVRSEENPFDLSKWPEGTDRMAWFAPRAGDNLRSVREKGNIVHDDHFNKNWTPLYDYETDEAVAYIDPGVLKYFDTPVAFKTGPKGAHGREALVFAYEGDTPVAVISKRIQS